jgi:Na+-driven multidrug efflux pump
MAAALAMQSIVGNNVGAGRWDRADQVLRIAAGTALIYGAVVELLLLTQGRLIASAFIADAGVIEEVARILKPMAALYLFSGPVLVLALYFQAIGRPLQAGLLTLMKSFVLLPVTIIVIATFLDRTAIWFAFPIADGLTVAIAAVVLGAVAIRGGERMRQG